MSTYNIVLSTNESTVVTEYEPQTKRSDAYQSEAALEAAFIKMLGEQGYEYVTIRNADALIANLRRQLELLNNYQFTDKEWDSFNDEIKPKPGSKDSIMDDVVFEMELVKQVEVNIDYILMLVAKYHDGNCEDKEILVAIDKAIKSSLQLRSKKELIENFIATINTSTDVNADWQRFVREQRETDIQTLITEEKLKSEETRKFVENAFRDGILKTTGTDVDRLMPPVSRFGGGGSHDKKKQTVIEKLKAFFEKYFGLVSLEVSEEPDKVTYLYDTEPTLSMVAEELVHYGMKKDN